MRILFTLCLLTFVARATAGTIRGHVKDEKGEALAFATVFIQGTTIGTTTNASGDYFFSAPNGRHEVVSRYLGYIQAAKPATITASDTIVIDFTLREEERSKAIGEVTVRAGEDPALRIIRKAIARRKEHLDQVESFQTSTYIKGVLRTRSLPKSMAAMGVSKKDMKEGKEEMGLDSAGKGVIYLVEQQADYFSAKGGKRRTVVKRVRESGDPRGLGLSSVPPVTTLYEENVRLFGGNPRGFVSPIADGAPGFYRYKLLGETVEAGRVIYAISVEPKRAYEPLFRGRIYIVNDEYAFHSLDLTATKTSGLESLDTVRLVQTFLPLPSGIWVIKSQQYYPAIKIFGFDIVGHLATVYDNQRVNEPIPDSIFGGKIVSSYEKDARNSDPSYWNAARSMPLETDEMRDFKVKDSLRIRDEDPARRDSLRRRANRVDAADIFLSGISYRGEDDRWSADLNGLVTSFSYNTVEGLNATLRPSVRWRLDTFHNLEMRTGLRYGVNNERFNAIAALAYRHRARGWAGRGGELTVTGGRFVFQIDPRNPVPPLLNAYATLVEGFNPLKIYERYEGSARYTWSGGNGFSISGGVSWQRRHRLENTTLYTWEKGSETAFTSNTPATYAAPVWEDHDAVLARVSARYQPGVRYVLQPDRKVPRGSSWPVFEASYTRGIPDLLGSRVDYDRWSVGLSDNARLRLLGTIEYRFEAGSMTYRYASLPDLIHFRGNEFTLASPYLQSFQGMPYYRYSNNEALYVEGHVEYNLQGLLSNKLPLLRQARWNLVTGGNAFYAGDDLRYGEVFVGVDNLGYKFLRFLRVDAVRAWGSLQEPAWLLRIGLKTGGAVSVSTGRNSDDEW